MVHGLFDPAVLAIIALGHAHCLSWLAPDEGSTRIGDRLGDRVKSHPFPCRDGRANDSRMNMILYDII